MFTREDILSGERFQQLCDVYCGDSFHLARNPKIAAEPQKHMYLENLNVPWSNPALVFCYSCALPLLMEKLSYFQNPFVLVSHNEDLNVVETFRPIADHPLVMKWFAQNLMMVHPKVVSIPIGIANEMWPHGNIQTLTQTIQMAKHIPKLEDVFFNFSLHTNPGQREHCRSKLLQKRLLWTNNLPHEVYVMKMASHQFAICPPGNGIDCHRTWEALYLGTIPVLLRSVFTETLQKSVPCILLDSWDAFSVEACKEQYENIRSQYEGWTNKLKFSYYEAQIKEAVTSLSLQKRDIRAARDTQELQIVYAFIGTLPVYTVDTVHQLRLFYDGPVYLIINDLGNPLVDILRDTYSVSIVSYEDVKDATFNALVQRVYHKFCIVQGLAGREKLFIYAFERFYLLYNLMIQCGLTNVFFLELDNLLYNDPRKWETGFALHEMSYMFDNYDRGASGICSIRSTDILRKFLDHCSHFIEFTTEFITEMTTLFRFWKEQNNRVGMIPVHWPTDGVPVEASAHFNMYNRSIFDAASLGIFIGGMDPHHTGGVIQKGLRGKWSLLDYTKYTYKWEMDTKGRNIPYILGSGDTWLRINNLHIHSKDLKPCMSDADPPAKI
jgi:hypothetical protein